MLNDALDKLFRDRPEPILVFHSFDGTILYVNHTIIPRHGERDTLELAPSWIGRSMRDLCASWGQAYEQTVAFETAEAREHRSRRDGESWILADPMDGKERPAVFVSMQSFESECDAKDHHQLLFDLAALAVDYAEADKFMGVAGEMLRAATMRMDHLESTILRMARSSLRTPKRSGLAQGQPSGSAAGPERD